MNRRTALKLMSYAIIGLQFNPVPLAYLVTEDCYHDNSVTRSWHIFWGNYPNAKNNFINSHWKYCKKQIIHDINQFPTPVKKAVDLERPLAPPITSYDQFHVFRTYNINKPIDYSW